MSLSRRRSADAGDLARHAAAAAGVRHQHAIAPGERQVGGQRRALVAALFLGDLHQHDLPALDDLLDLVVPRSAASARRSASASSTSSTSSPPSVSTLSASPPVARRPRSSTGVGSDTANSIGLGRQRRRFGGARAIASGSPLIDRRRSEAARRSRPDSLIVGRRLAFGGDDARQLGRRRRASVGRCFRTGDAVERGSAARRAAGGSRLDRLPARRPLLRLPSRRSRIGRRLRQRRGSEAGCAARSGRGFARLGSPAAHSVVAGSGR